MRPIFTILWIDDTESIIRHQERAITKFLDDEGYDLNLIIAIDEESFLAKYKSELNIDIIVTDFNISVGFDGTDVIKFVRDNKKLTDVLIYSAKDGTFKDKELYSTLGHYGLVKIWEGKDVEEPLIDLVNKNLQRFEDVTYLRGFVISRAVDLEIRLNEVISCYFKIHPDLLEEFHNLMLESGSITMNSKKFLIAKILEKNGWSEEADFRDLFKLIGNVSKQRNLLAHCKKDPNNPAQLISAGKTIEFNHEKIHLLLKNIYSCEGKLDKLLVRCHV